MSVVDADYVCLFIQILVLNCFVNPIASFSTLFLLLALLQYGFRASYGA